MLSLVGGCVKLSEIKVPAAGDLSAGVHFCLGGLVWTKVFFFNDGLGLIGDGDSVETDTIRLCLVTLA